MKNSDQQKSYGESLKDVAPYMGLGVQLAATMVLMFFLGKWLDSKFEIYPVLTIIFLFLGAAAGIYNFIKVVLQINRKNEKN